MASYLHLTSFEGDTSVFPWYPLHSLVFINAFGLTVLAIQITLDAVTFVVPPATVEFYSAVNWTRVVVILVFRCEWPLMPVQAITFEL